MDLTAGTTPPPGAEKMRGHALYSILVYILLSSLDNMALAVLPPMYHAVATGLHVREGSLGVVTAGSILVLAVTAAVWGYWADRVSRKGLLLAGTVIWATGMASSGLAGNYALLLACQFAAAIGLGCIASVGFNIVAEFIPPARRGVVLALFGVAQGIGVGGGVLLGGFLGSSDWRLPFFVVSGLGLVFGLMGVFAREPSRGQAEGLATGAPPEHDEGSMDFGTLVRHVPIVLERQSNGWIILQGFAAQFAFGSLIWLPRVLEAKAQSADPGGGHAMAIGSLLAVAVNLGGAFSIVGGYLGDRWHRRDLRGRAFLSTVTLLAGVPFFVAMLLLPLPALPGVGGSMFGSPGLIGVGAMALLAVGLSSASGPNWMSLVNDVNPPEHRGTMIGIVNMANGFARAAGNGTTGLVIALLSGLVDPPWNYVGALALFQLAFIPSALCFLRAARWLPGDITTTREALAARAHGPSA